MKIATLILIASASGPMAAEPSASLKGRVTDASGAPLTDAVVVVREPDGLALRRVTDELGRYSFEGLPPASYAVRIAKPGFRSYDADGIKVDGATTLDRCLGSAGPARTINAAEWDRPGPDLRAALRAAIQQPKWAHVKLVPEFDYSAPSSTEPAADLRARSRFSVADVAMAAHRESPQLAPVFAPGNPGGRAAFRIRFSF